MTIEKKLRDAEAKAKEIRAAQKQVLRAVKHARASRAVVEAIQKEPDEVNLELAIDGEIAFDFNLDEYPELQSEVLLLIEKIHAIALERVA